MADSKKLDGTSAWLGAITALVLPLILLGGAVWGGFVFATLWNWFGEPLSGYRLSLPEAIGLMTIYAFVTLRWHRMPLPSDEQPKLSVTITRWLSSPLLLLTGYVAHLFMGRG